MKALKSALPAENVLPSESAEEARYREITVKVLAALSIVALVSSLLAGAGFLFSFVPGDTFAILLGMDVLFYFGLILARRGRWKAVRHIPVVVMFSAAFYGNLIGGMGAPAILIYILAIVLSAMLQEKRTQILVFSAAFMSYLSLAVLHHCGIIRALRSDADSFSNRILIAASIFIGIASALRFLLGRLEEANREMRLTLMDLKVAAAKTEAQNWELLRLNEKLELSERRFSKAFRFTPAPMVISEIETGRFIDVNEQWLKMIGRSREETIGRTSFELGIWEDPEVRIRMGNILLRDGFFRECPVRFVTKSGEVRDTLWSAETINFGGVKTMLSVIYDYTDRKKYEEEIKKLYLATEQKVLTRTEELRAANRDLTVVNVRLEKTLLELSRTQNKLVLSEKLAALGQIAAGIAHELNTPIGAVQASNRAMVDLLRTEFPALSRFIAGLNEAEGRWFDALLEDSFRRAVDLEGSAAGTGRRESAEALRNAGVEGSPALCDAVRELGLQNELAAHAHLLAHERRDEFFRHAATLSTIRRLNEIISVAADKAAQVVVELKNYLRSEEDSELGPVDVHREIETVLTLQRSKLRCGVTVEKRFSAATRVLGKRSRLNQVWMNLIDNALYAMEYSGTLSVTTEFSGEWLVVSVADTGRGIPEALKERIFEPFFTTKKLGEGIGLGLHLSRSIVERSGGRIEFESVPGSTVFRVFLPLAEESRPGATA